MQVNRLLEIVYVLLRRKVVTAKELSEQFGVSRRTIYRDLDILSSAGIPVYAEKGRGGGIRLLPEFVLGKAILSDQEQNEILVALQGLSSVKGIETDQVLEKLAATFNKTIVNWLDVDFSSWSFANEHLFNDFKTAILRQQIVEFDYFGANGEKTYRRIEPIQLRFKSKAWYLSGYCLDKQDLRLFKLVRIKNLILTNESFPKRNPLDVPSRNKPAPDPRQDVTLKLRIEPEMTNRVFDEFAEEMLEKQADGSFIVTVTWPEDHWVYGFILSFGEYIEVLEPKHVREIIQGKSQKIQQKYLSRGE